MKPMIHRNKSFRKKKYLKTNAYTTINTGSSYMPPRVDALFAYRARAKPVDPELEKLFGLSDMEEYGDPRMAAEALRKKLIAMDSFAADNPVHNICCTTGRYRRVFLFWNKNRTIYKFIEVRYFTNSPPVQRESLTLASRDQALRLFEMNQLHWLPFEPLIPSRD